jgi:DNA repair protein RadA/Sms
MNVIGGLSISEPAADLAIATALVSSLTDRVVPDDLIVIGELGLAGECRAVTNLEQRVREAARLGFTRAVVPFRNVEKRAIRVEGMEIVPVKSVFEVLQELRALA